MNNEKTEQNKPESAAGLESVKIPDKVQGTVQEPASDIPVRRFDRPIESYRPEQHLSEQDRYATDKNLAPLWAAMIGFGAGMATMYLLDPNTGNRRRALIRDQFTHAGSKLPNAFRATERDMWNRTQGLLADMSSLFTSEDPSDQVIEARVRSKLGRVCSHPHAIHVASNNGRVTLSGVILKDEVPTVLKTVEELSGVNEVENALREFDSPEGISSLQGGRRREMLGEFQQENWSPAARLFGGMLGGAALAYSITKRDLPSLGLGAAGAALLARSATNTDIRRLIGNGDGRSAITVDRSISVNAPPDVLFELWSNLENFPLFMSNVLEVTNINDSLSHWRVAGPAGIPVQWDAEITKIVPNEMIAWKSVPGSSLPNAGYVLFEPNTDGSTEVTVRISYTPPAGALGHLLAKAFGADPKTEMDQDLTRMKTYLETGRLPDDAAQSTSRSQKADRIH